MRKPRVNTNPVANTYSSPAERIVEFHSGKPGGSGGLISFRRLEDGTLQVDLYQLDPAVVVNVSAAR
jgi:hypothetical protein